MYCTTAGVDLNSTEGVYHYNGDKKKEANDGTIINVDVEITHKNRQPGFIGAVNTDNTISEPETSGECGFVLTSTVSFTG